MQRKWLAATVAMVGLGLCLATNTSVVRGQSSNSALKDRVAQLVGRLDSDKEETRDAAENDLVKLGAKALPLLPEVTKDTSKEKKARLEKVRKRIEEAEEKANLGATKVTIKGQGIRLSEAIRQLQSQSGNMITDLREQSGDVTNPGLDLDIENKPFFEALDIIAQKADVALNFFTGDGSIGLMPTGTSENGEARGVAPKPSPFVIYSGPFRITFKQIFANRDLVAGTGTASAQFEVAWEPRLRPMLLGLDSDELVIKDDTGKTVPPQVTEESTDVVLRPENPVAELNINMTAPERASKMLTSLHVKGELTVPGGLRTFKFPKLTASNEKQKLDDISVTLEDFEVDEQVWKVHVNVAYPGSGPAFESYRQGLFNNRLWLQKADGSRFEHNGGFSQTMADGGKIGFEYLFVDAPGKPADYQFVYETPSKVISIPVEFEFKDVPLP